MSRGRASEIVGVSGRTARDWDRGVRKSNGRRLYPDGRLVDYARGVTTIIDVATPLNLVHVERVLDARFVSLSEREQIADLRRSGLSVRAVAARLGRAPSTVSREIRRNACADGRYAPFAAHRAAAARRPRPKTAKLTVDGPLRAYLRGKLALRWSPEQICHALVTDFPDDLEMRVSHETIYQALYLQARGGLRREVAAALRTGRARRRPRRDPNTRTSRFVDPMVMISERPSEVADRAVPGHWEGDLIIGADGGSAIGTLVERTTRYVMLVHLPHGRTAEQVRDGLVTTMATLPAHLRGSLTWDQGAEMAAHRSFSLATDIQVYFCDPASPWQRGSNENTNGLLRQYFPKGTDLSVFGPEDLEHVAQELNGRPRKTLGWKNPAERLGELLSA
ncbi:IS30 family transposase [Cellulomonas sp. KRMCY2]|uniref:IS30 family transposase n=1 Tax=Cellulomonas sp. KRMCY2 TaxID=1304865 RepID=UPI0012DBDFB4|nr:IS30 family transposase [Cellulomonas sp. KRMCY2]